jgi:D-alanyl-D-alanine carboxypeptidase/D-alanyl-D-alanine-endopeptidase (penicillin-binding protein 4)
VASIGRVFAVVGTAVAVVGGGGAGVAAYRAAQSPAVPSASPSSSPMPTAVRSPARSPFDLDATPSAGPAAVPSGVARALAGPLAVPTLGARVDATVADATSGATLYDRGGAVAVVPASTAKLFTAAAALHALGAQRRLATRVLATGPVESGVLRGDLVVVGGGDPTLAATGGTSYPRPASLAELARRVRAAGVARVTGGVVVDTSLFATPGLGPGWKPTYVSEGSVAPVTAFEVDGGRSVRAGSGRAARPDLAGGARLRDALRRAGVSLGNAVRTGSAPGGATEVASVQSPTVAALVERMLTRSDNDLAEALARHVALARGLRTDFAGAAAAVAATVRDLGLVAPALVDACGLSPRNRVTPAQLVALLALATRDATLAPLVQGLPVAGFTGTLASRYAKGAAARAAGWVRAKTGSLDNVATLAGIVETRSGRLLVFAFAADRLPTRFVGAAAKALDVAAAALAACGCG